MSDRHLFRLTMDGFNCEACGAYVAKADRPTMGRKAFAKLRFCSKACAGATRSVDVLERFHSSYEVDALGCWNWKKARTPKGYGTFWAGKGFARAHRWIYEQLKGPLGDAVCRHKCDNPACVNPDHLEPGTQADNLADAVARGRNARGERASSAKLTEADVRAIRAHGGKMSAIAEQFGIAASTACQIRNRQRWKHIP